MSFGSGLLFATFVMVSPTVTSATAEELVLVELGQPADVLANPSSGVCASVSTKARTHHDRVVSKSVADTSVSALSGFSARKEVLKKPRFLTQNVPFLGKEVSVGQQPASANV